ASIAEGETVFLDVYFIAPSVKESGAVTVSATSAEVDADPSNNTGSFAVQIADFTPDRWSLPPLTDVPLNTVVTSNVIQLTGFDAPISVSSQGGGEYSLN